jgi:hypothetical protein
LDAGAIKERNLALEGYCQTQGCGHFYVFNVDNLISGMGADYVVYEISRVLFSRHAAET